MLCGCAARVRLVFCGLVLIGGGAGFEASRAQSPEKVTSDKTTPQHQCVDGIAIVVNKEVITWREVDEGVQSATRALTQQHIQLPPWQVLQRQVAQRLIMETLQRQEAARLHIEVNQEQVEQAIAMVAARNHMSVLQLQQAVEKMEMAWPQYRKNIEDEIVTDALRQRMVGANIVISNAEVKAFLQAQQRRQAQENLAQTASPSSSEMRSPERRSRASGAPATAGTEFVTLAQILVRVPENASSEQVAALRKKAQALLSQIKNGADFASVAAASSEGPHALEGGLMGERPLENWPDLFMQAIAHLDKGGVSAVFQSGNGFHILKVMNRHTGQPQASSVGGASGLPGPGSSGLPGPGAPSRAALAEPVEITQTYVRHILIKPSSIMTDDQARQRLLQLRQRILKGGDFAALAHRYSQDATAPQGGELGWLSPGEAVPAFEEAMNALKPGEISDPVHTQFGWHLIQVQKRRQQDMKDTLESMQASQALYERRLELGFQDYLEQLRDQAYVDNRVEKRQQDGNGDVS